MSEVVQVTVTPFPELELELVPVVVPTAVLVPQASPAVVVTAQPLTEVLSTPHMPLSVTVAERGAGPYVEPDRYSLAALDSVWVWRGGTGGAGWFVDRWPRPAGSGPRARASQANNTGLFSLDAAWPARSALNYS